ncbi:uncharacterized protein FA14DRAFT_176949 [Meira miltonrushii]|uniref:t-SNARE coiled-coil homology domain-containing protein n=1 Tax=Meira miltonrushii TaxID=1280837 RepID=A0A316VJ72_9BASI|nr:uncharacterized protein FA14DRAFT_176949 [Meira miltonrushii]PWN37662.1 hypothetical protein FA14DRAFT_176949 [Meira miltonrushii]
MSTSADRTYEEQNDASLNKLFDKVKALRGVTTDIYNDAESQTQGLLGDASEGFDNFAARLSNTSSRFTRQVVNGGRGSRMILYIVGGFVGILVLYRILF